MREHDEEDPKAPHLDSTKKRSNPAEAAEAIPIRKGDERDHHRHRV